MDFETVLTADVYDETAHPPRNSGAISKQQCTEWLQPFALRFLKTLMLVGKLMHAGSACCISEYQCHGSCPLRFVW